MSSGVSFPSPASPSSFPTSTSEKTEREKSDVSLTSGDSIPIAQPSSSSSGVLQIGEAELLSQAHRAQAALDSTQPTGVAALASIRSTIEINEMNDAEGFHTAISEARNHGYDNHTSEESKWYGASVNVYPVEEYGEMRLFTSENRLYGFALHDTDVVSVFRHPDGEKGALDAIIPKAVREGGRRLDCFSINNMLPIMYSKYGFEIVAKVKFNPDLAPSDWNHNRDGGPDIVFMAYNPKVATLKSTLPERKAYVEKKMAEIEYVTYDEAQRLQKEFVEA